MVRIDGACSHLSRLTDNYRKIVYVTPILLIVQDVISVYWRH